MVNLKQFKYKKVVGSLLLGQFLSLLILSTSYSSSELARSGINAPTSQSFLNYVLLLVVYGITMLCRWKPLKAKWYYYLLLGMIDVEANFLVVKAYQYTNLTSAMLLDCWTIPCVLLFTRIFLKTKYGWKKLVGVVFCVVGSIVVVFSDYYDPDRAAGINPVKGDLFVIAGATLYAVSNVSEEYLVKSADQVELMGMLGLFGAIVSAIQISILERNEVKSIHWTRAAALPFFGFSAAMFSFYSLVPILLMISGSAMLNLSLLTSDMWGVLIRIFQYHEKVDWLYYVAFASVVVGLGVYSWGDKDKKRHRAVEVEEEEQQDNQDKAENKQWFDEEAAAAADNENPGQGTTARARGTTREED